MKKTNLPASSGGIVQYFDETASKILISPKQVIFVSVTFVIVVIILKWTNLLNL